MLNSILRKFRSFGKDTDGGTAAIEFLIFGGPMLVMLFASYVYYDAFRQKAINTNAAYTISDALSRETDAITNDYMDGMHDLLEFLTQSDDQVGLRVTMVKWNKKKNEYRRDWSKTRGPLYPLKNREVDDAIGEFLPTLLHNERVIVVETSTMYDPLFNVPGIDEHEMYNFAFTRPRFAPKLVWDGS